MTEAVSSTAVGAVLRADAKERDFSQKQRDKMADKGTAMDDGSYPIANRSDLANAVQAFGRAKDPAAVKRHIIKRAHALGAAGSLPKAWNVKEAFDPDKDAGTCPDCGQPLTLTY